MSYSAYSACIVDALTHHANLLYVTTSSIYVNASRRYVNASSRYEIDLEEKIEKEAKFDKDYKK